MSTKRVVALVVGCVMILPALGMLLGGGALAIAYATQRDDDGYFDVTIDQLQTPTAAISGGDVRFAAEPGSPDWLIDLLDLDVRLQVTALDPDAAVFVGIARQTDLNRYLADVTHDRVVRLDNGVPVYRARPGSTDALSPPAEETFWIASAAGSGAQELTWSPTSGRWAAIVANTDGSPGVLVSMGVGAKSGLILPVAVTLLALGVIGVAVSVVLIVYGAAGARRRSDANATGAGTPGPGTSATTAHGSFPPPPTPSADAPSDEQRTDASTNALVQTDPSGGPR